MKGIQLTYMIFLLFVIIGGCNYQYVDEGQFIGNWELQGRRSFEGMQIEIRKENGQLKGKIIKLPDSKIVRMFAEEGDVWVKKIERTSNYAFELTETRIAAELFSMYDMSTSTVFKAEFIHENKIGLAQGSGQPVNSKIVYKRIK